jgi:hypothetical protein
VPPDASKADGTMDEARQSLPNLALVFDNHHGTATLMVALYTVNGREPSLATRASTSCTSGASAAGMAWTQ